jgi:hypothetical protein
MPRHPCGSPLKNSHPSLTEARGGRALLRPATFSRYHPRHSRRWTADPTGARFPKEHPSRRSGGRRSVKWPFVVVQVAWQSSSRLLDETRAGPEASAGHRSGPKTLAALSSRPEGRGDSPSGRGRAGSPRRVSPRSGPAARTRRGRRRRWPFVAFGRSADARFGAAVRDGAARPVARFASARRRVRRGRGACRPRPGTTGIERRAPAAEAAGARLPRTAWR